MNEVVSLDALNALKHEVLVLENKNAKSILVFEKNLEELSDLPLIDDSEWSPSLKSVEIITLEKYPSLSTSIRKLDI